jgi:hypothetical protein
MLRNEHRKHRRQQHEDKGLHYAHEYLHKIKWDRRQPRQPHRHHVRHRFQNALARLNIAEKTKTQRNRAEQNRYDFEPAHHEKDHGHQHLQNPCRFALGRE